MIDVPRKIKIRVYRSTFEIEEQYNEWWIVRIKYGGWRKIGIIDPSGRYTVSATSPRQFTEEQMRDSKQAAKKAWERFHPEQAG